MNGQPTIPEVQLSEFLYRKATRKKIPLSGTFELSPVCNFSCRMCYVRKTPREVLAHDRKVMTLEQWLEIAREARDAGLLYLLLTGGEPFLWPDFWTLYDELIAMGILISINTNGSLIDDAAIAHLKRLPPRRVNITLYGGCDETYERLCGAKHMFSRVDRAITGLIEAGIPVKLNCSLTPYNICDQEAIIRYAQDRDLVLNMVTYMFPPVRRDPTQVGVNDRFTPEDAARFQLRCYRLQQGEERYREYLEKIRSGCIQPPGLDEYCYDPLDGTIRCRAGKASFWITWDGWLSPCGLMTEPRVDLAGADFGPSWRALTELSAQTRLSGVCGKCPNQQVCHVCAAMALAETGRSTGIPQYRCHMTEHMRKIAWEEK